MPVASPDLFDAIIVYLRTQTAVTSAFQEDQSGDTTTKFWGDLAPPGTDPPFMVYLEPEADTQWMTAAQGKTSGVEQGVLRIAVAANEKYQARQLADLLGTTLDISRATITFQDGTLMYLRKRRNMSVAVPDVFPQNPVGYARLLLMDYAVQRTA